MCPPSSSSSSASRSGRQLARPIPRSVTGTAPRRSPNGRSLLLSAGRPPELPEFPPPAVGGEGTRPAGAGSDDGAGTTAARRKSRVRSTTVSGRAGKIEGTGGRAWSRDAGTLVRWLVGSLASSSLRSTISRWSDARSAFASPGTAAPPPSGAAADMACQRGAGGGRERGGGQERRVCLSGNYVGGVSAPQVGAREGGGESVCFLEIDKRKAAPL
ncbi:hypothetical protein T484DRAFT_3646190, partial [Baffinella frigidus]